MSLPMNPTTNADQKVAWRGLMGWLMGFIVGYWRGTVYLDDFPLAPALPVDAMLLGLQPLGHAVFFAVVGWWSLQFWNGVPVLAEQHSGTIVQNTDSTEPAECAATSLKSLASPLRWRVHS